MLIEITKGEREDAITAMRDDGSVARTTFPKKGTVPHDAVHLIVEGVLGLSRGFWGMIAEGHAPEEIQEIAKAAGHASAKRAREPEAHIVELLQAERIVECFEAEMWSAPADIETLRGVIASACGYSYVPVPLISDAMIADIRRRLAELLREWAPAPAGHVIRFTWRQARA